MKKYLFFILILFFGISCTTENKEYRTISIEVLKDKIAGGWAGKMIGVTYGFPTEFVAQGHIFEDSIRWTPDDIDGSLWQDDLYVQLSFMMTMDKHGVDAPAKEYQKSLATAGFSLFHANAQAQKNYYDSIFPPMSGHPDYNFHADDIDFQIESDYIGFMCPSMPNQAVELADKVGHIMNYGDGYYGGVFVAALYAEAFFESNILSIVEHALKSIPVESDYHRIIKDVILLYEHYPNDWRETWQELENKWGNVKVCGSGTDFNIDAKLNGAYIVLGLLYGEGDYYKTLEITTRCGQDSDCNPSNAMAVLGVMNGLSSFPQDMRESITNIGDSTFVNTNYTFNKAVENTYQYAVKFVKERGGEIISDEIKIKREVPIAPELEVSFPDNLFSYKFSIFETDKWQFTNDWPIHSGGPNNVYQTRYGEKAGDELEFTFEGTGICLNGNWVRDGGKADIYLDGTLHRTIDTYSFYGNQEHWHVNLWHAFNLEPGEHTVKVVVKEEKRPESEGTRVYVSEALIYKTGTKKSDTFKFSFQ
ncbi:ADP-ribosylglycohydrolase family protein [Proteiniphilum sp.]|uniref:ADP-ribosylglycohydrolase family protein n=1 Tax=Proteiniphilum sp. TaxID=1926877 RepID=UPI0033233E50